MLGSHLHMLCNVDFGDDEFPFVLGRQLIYNWTQLFAGGSGGRVKINQHGAVSSNRGFKAFRIEF